MTKVINVSIAYVAFAAIIFGFSFASAATISDPLFSNGQTSIDVTGGSTVSGTFTLTVGAGEVVEWQRCQADTMPFGDVSLGGNLGKEEGVYTNMPFSAKVAPNTGTYNVNCQGAGTFGGNRSINGGDNVVVGPTSVGMVRVVAVGSGNGPVGGNDVTLESLQKQIADLLKIIADLQKPQVPAKPAFCASMPTVNSWSGSSAVIMLQAWLVQNGFMTDAQMSTGPGTYGPKTTASHFAAQNACR